MSRETLTFFFFHVRESCSSLTLLPHLVVVMQTQKQGPLTNLTPGGVSLLENKDKEEPPKNRAVFNLSQIILSIL